MIENHNAIDTDKEHKYEYRIHRYAYRKRKYDYRRLQCNINMTTVKFYQNDHTSH